MSFEESFTQDVNHEIKLTIANLVIDKCISANFITKTDIVQRTSRKKWVDLIVDRNIDALTLLELVEINSFKSTTLSEHKNEVEAKAAIIIKDIAKRIMMSLPPMESNLVKKAVTVKAMKGHKGV